MTTRSLPRLPLPALALGLGFLGLTGLVLHLGRPDEPPATPSVQAASGVPAAAVKPIAVAALPDARSELQLGNPVVSMDAERGLLEAQLALAVRLPGQAPLTGTVQVTGKPRLDETGKRFFLDAPTLVSTRLPALPAGDRARIDAALRPAVAEFFRQRAVFAPLEKGPLTIDPLRAPIS